MERLIAGAVRVRSAVRYIVRRFRRGVAVLAETVRKQRPDAAADRFDPCCRVVDASGGWTLGRTARRPAGLPAPCPRKLHRRGGGSGGRIHVGQCLLARSSDRSRCRPPRLAPTTSLADALTVNAARPRKAGKPFEYGRIRGAASAAFLVGTLVIGQLIVPADLSPIIWMNAALLIVAAAATALLPSAAPEPATSCRHCPRGSQGARASRAVAVSRRHRRVCLGLWQPRPL